MKKFLLLTVCFILAMPVNNFAAVNQKHNWELGTEVYYFKYDEPDVMEENGVFSGVTGSYTYRNDIVLKAEGRIDYGVVDYEGSGTLDDVRDWTAETRGLVGYGFKLSERHTFTPYFGLGYRYLNDDLSGKTTSTGARGYDRESHYFYSPIGAELLTSLDNGWSVGLTAEYDIFWLGRQDSHLSDVLSSVSDVENDQDEGYGVRGSIKIQKECDKIDFIIEPFIRYWNIEKSDVSTITVAGSVWGFGWEPENNTTEAGLRLAVKF